MEISVCQTDDDYEEWRAVRIAVLPTERTDTVAELRAQHSNTRVLVLARRDGVVVGTGMADKAETAGGGFAVPRVLPEHRRQGVGTALLHALADHCSTLDLPEIRSSVDDEGSLAFAQRLRLRRGRPAGRAGACGRRRTVTTGTARGGRGRDLLAERPELWAASYEGFGKEVLADFALFTPLDVSAEQWSAYWSGDPMFLALHEGEVVGCAGLHLDTDQPDRAENSLTAARRRLARPRAGRVPQAPHPALGLDPRRTRGLHLDPGGQRRDAAPQPAPRLRRPRRQHHRQPPAAALDLTPRP